MKSLSTIIALFSHSVNLFIFSYPSLSHDHSETLSAWKFIGRTKSSANTLASLLSNSPTTQKKIYKKAFFPSEENYLRAPHSTRIRVYYNSDKIKSFLFVFAALCGNEIIFSSIKDFFPASLDSYKSDDISCKHQPILCIDLDFIIIMLLYREQFYNSFVF